MSTNGVPDSAEDTIVENGWCRIYVRNDEIFVEQKAGVVDCPKIRFRSPEGSIGAFTWDRLINGAWVEVATVKGTTADSENGNPRAGHIRITLNDGGGSADRAQRNVVDLFHDKIRSHVPIELLINGHWRPLSLGSSAGTHKLVAPGGQAELHIQGDGNFVLYDTRTGSPDAGNVKPIWASNTFLPAR